MTSHVQGSRARMLFGGAAFIGGAALALSANAAQRRIAATETRSLEADAPGNFVRVDGYRLHYVEAGAADSPPIVLLHGFGSWAYSWHNIVPALQEGYRVIAPDMPPGGYSERIVEPIYSVRRRAVLLAGLLDALGVERAIFVGNSAGGGLAMQFAISYPERVAKLVLIDPLTGYGGGGAPPWQAGWLLQHTPLGALLLASTFYAGGRSYVILRSAWHDPDRLSAADFAAYSAPLRVRGTAAALLAATASPPDDDLPERIADIKAPTLIIWGREDKLIKPAQGERLHAEIAGSQLVIVDDAGHVPHEEQPRQVLAALRKFLRD